MFGQPSWLQEPFLLNGKTLVDHLLDQILNSNYASPVEDYEIRLDMKDMACNNSNRSQEYLLHDLHFKTQDPDNPLGHITAVLVNLHQLRQQPQIPLRIRETIASEIITDAKWLLEWPSVSFNVALQAVSALKLMAEYAPCFSQKWHAKEIFSNWNQYLLVQSPPNIPDEAHDPVCAGGINWTQKMAP